MRTTIRFGRAAAFIVVGIFGAPFSIFAGPLTSWDKVLPDAKERFVVLAEFADEAVLDNETNLVWERTPSDEAMDWESAREHCLRGFVGDSEATAGRFGWRLPYIEELQTLAHPTKEAPTLPPGHPFEGVSPSYWSVTNTNHLLNGLPGMFVHTFAPAYGPMVHPLQSSWSRAWCVRGGPGRHDWP